jgi:Ca2+-binding RTX toxin-like protein
VVVRNDGPATDPGVELTQELPSGAIVLATETGAGDTCARTGDAVRCTLGAMDSGDAATVRFTFVPVSRGRFRPVARVTGSQSDPSIANDTSTLTIDVRRAICTIRGTGADEKLKGTRGRDVICGRGGDDRIRGRGGDDVVLGRGGGDLLVGGGGTDVAIGGGGADDLRIADGVAGNDAALGGGGVDACRSDTGDVVRGCE